MAEGEKARSPGKEGHRSRKGDEVLAEGAVKVAEVQAGAVADRSRLLRRELFVHDGLSFVVLAVIALALYGVTLFLFRSFEGHRERLAQQFAAEGQSALTRGDAKAAVASMRAALAYAPDEVPDQRLLAEALAADGKTEEALNYFLALHDVRPGDGFLNLQLARLERKRGEVPEAVEYYRASVFGDWRGEGIVRRREVRLELADYLLAEKRPDEAHTELIIAASNAPDTEALDLLFSEKLRATGDLQGAFAEQRKALAKHPKSAVALVAAGETAFALREFPVAHGYLVRALEEKGALNGAEEAQVRSMAGEADRLTELSLSRELPARVRAAHLRAAETIARARFMACSALPLTSVATGAGKGQGAPAVPAAGGAPAAVVALQQRWRQAGLPQTQSQMQVDADVQDAIMALIFDTERTFAEPSQLSTGSSACGAPTGDDALLLRLAEREPANGGVSE